MRKLMLFVLAVGATMGAWADMLVNKPDYVVYVPELPCSAHRSTTPRQEVLCGLDIRSARHTRTRRQVVQLTALRRACLPRTAGEMCRGWRRGWRPYRRGVGCLSPGPLETAPKKITAKK